MDSVKDKKTDDILEKLVHINRITKVVKGGRRFGFSALVVVGNQSGKIGIAHAKAKQVPDAIKKANEMARRKLTHIPLREGRTIHHDVKAKDGSGRIVLRAASKGTGIIAGGPVRAVCEVLGVKDIVAKSMGTSNAHNVIRATMKALMKQSSPKQISTIRNKKISEIFLFLILDICLGEFCLSKAFIVALITLCAFEVPIDLATISLTPKTSHTALTGPPAIIPVPFAADLKTILPEPSLAFTSWWIVLPSLKGIWISLRLAISLAFLIASGTCLALAWAIPILPDWFPTTTNAEKPNLLPPLTTLVIRLMCTNFSKISSFFLSLLSSIIKIPFHFF